jgi:MATE family multidrug resistance protein
MKSTVASYLQSSDGFQPRWNGTCEWRDESLYRTARCSADTEQAGKRQFHTLPSLVHEENNSTRKRKKPSERVASLLRIGDHQKTILGLSLPVVAGLSAQMMLSLIDTALVARLPDAKYELAATGIAFYLTWTMISFFSSISTGTQVLTSRNSGSKNYKECGTILTSSMIMAGVLGIVIAAVVITFSRSIAGFFAVDNRVADLAGGYLFYRFLGVPFFLLSVAYRGFYFGIGKTKVFMFAAVLANVLNIVLDYTLIYGAIGIKGMGLAGAGLGASIAAALETSVYFIVSISKGYRNRFEIFERIRFNKSMGKAILKISLPISFQSVFTLSGLLLYVSMTGLLGTVQQAASQTVLSALLLSYLPSMGFGVAAQTLVGRRLAENEISHAKQWGFETSQIATTYTALLGLIFIFLPKYVLSLLTGSNTIIEFAIPILRIAGIAQIFFGIGFVLANGLFAGGESFFVMLADITINWFIFVPLAYYLGIILKLGLNGVWAAMPFYTSLYALVMFRKFKYGIWRKLPQPNSDSLDGNVHERAANVRLDVAWIDNKDFEERHSTDCEVLR